MVIHFLLGDDRGLGLVSVGMVVNTIGYAVAALLHPKPLSER